jgi:hypothetical protein
MMVYSRADFTYPEVSTYTAAHVASKTRKLPDGTFEAVAALWAPGGMRCNLKYAVAPTRHAAEKAALKMIGC